MTDPQTASVFTTIFINSIWGLFLLLLFEKFRHQRNVFAPKMYWEQDHPKVQSPNPGLFAWAVQLWHIYDDDMIELAGMDAYVLLRYLRMCFVVGVTCSVPALVVLLPVYYSSTPAMEVGINMLSMGNIDVGGSALWASLVFTYLFTIVFLIAIHYEYGNFADKRVKYFKSGDRSLPLQMLYTVQVENVPPDLRCNSKLVSLFDEFFPGEVHSGSVVLALPELQSALEDREVARGNLELAIAGLEASKDHEAPKVTLVDGETSWFGCCLSCSPRCCCCCISSSKVTKENAIQFWSSQLRKHCNFVSSIKSVVSYLSEGDKTAVKAVQQQDKVLAEIDLTNRVSKTGFITFKTRKAHTVACQVAVVIGKHPYMKVHAAPAPTDIIWENMTTDIYKIKRVRVVTLIILTAGFLFWGAVLAFVSAVSSLANLDKYFPVLKQLNAFTRAILAGQLPVIALIVFVGQLPAILTFIVKNIEKRKTRSDVQDNVFRWFFKYQIANVFLILITGSLFNALAKISSNPVVIFSILGTALPQVSVFFMNYMITQLLSGVPAILFRYVDYIIFLFYRLFLNEKSLTRRAFLEGPLAKISVDYGQELPSFLYYVFVTFIFWVISPITLLISTVLFLCLYVAWKYQFAFVIVPNSQGGGHYWYGLYDYSMVGLLASTVTMIGYMGIKQGVAQTPLLLPLPVIILAARKYTCHEFRKLSLYLPYSDATENLTSANVSSAPSSAAARASTTSSATPAPGSDYSMISQEEVSESVTATSTLQAAGNTQSIYDSFSSSTYKQPALTAPNRLVAYPYRLQDIPLFNEAGELNRIYYYEEPPSAWAKQEQSVQDSMNEDFIEVDVEAGEGTMSGALNETSFDQIMDDVCEEESKKTSSAKKKRKKEKPRVHKSNILLVELGEFRRQTPSPARQRIPVIRANSRLRNQLSSRAKVSWEPDNKHPTCMKCNKKFTLVFRRHHCRKCGGVFCANCTSCRIGTPPVRVCLTCAALVG